MCVNTYTEREGERERKGECEREGEERSDSEVRGGMTNQTMYSETDCV
jgi:hypothetical protein